MRALVPMPLTLPLCVPEAPPPARVVTAPQGVTMRTFLLDESATYTSPVAGKMARPLGALKRAANPVPSMLPAPATAGPASGATVPSGVTSRTAWFPVSLNTTKPLAFTARPWGPEICAASAGPKVSPAVPEPARVLTAPAGVTARSL
jgi:hypothetical protein